MISKGSDSDTRSPQGWAIIGAFLGVLFGYIGTIENTLLVATTAIIVGGVVGAIVMNEIEYQFISSTGIVGTNFSDLPGSIFRDSVITLSGPARKTSMFSRILDRLITGGTSDSLDRVEELKYKQPPYFGRINVDNDELVEFLSKHRDQLNVYPSYFIVKEDHGGGLIILNSALPREDGSDDIPKTVWYSSNIYHDVPLDDKYLFLLEDDFNFSSDSLGLDESEDRPNSIDELLDGGDENQSNS